MYKWAFLDFVFRSHKDWSESCMKHSWLAALHWLYPAGPTTQHFGASHPVFPCRLSLSFLASDYFEEFAFLPRT